MAVVTEVKEYKGVVSVWIDGVFAARIRRKHFAARPLEAGECVDFEAWLDAISASQANEAYEAALTSLDRAARTSSDLDRSLRAKGYAAPCVRAVVERLQANRLVDDAQYAQRMAETHLTRPVGAFAVRRKMMAKGISAEEAETAMSAFDENQQADAAFRAARGLWRKYEDLPPRQARGKLSQALARRGFPWDAVSAAVDRITDEEWE